MQTPKAISFRTRKSCQQAALVLALVGAGTAFGQGEDDKDKGGTVIEINDVSMRGSGCKPGTSKIYSFQSQGPDSPIDSFLMEHRNFAVGKSNDDGSKFRVFCNAAFKIELPIHKDKTKSYQFGILAVRQSGFMDVTDGVTASITTYIGQRGVNALQLSAATRKEGPFKGDFFDVIEKFYDKQGNELPYWSQCGIETHFNIKTEVKLTGPTKDRRESGVILDKVTNDEETDKRQEYAQDFRIHWRECTLPPPPEEDDY